MNSDRTPLKVVYFGTPDFAVPALNRLATDSRFSVEMVVTQPDRPAGRGRKLTSPQVKEAAQALAVPVYQPESLRGDEDKRPIKAANADLFVVAAYGKIFGRTILEMPRLGCVNLHASLLPRYRGASPITAAILCGDERTGVTLMKMDVGLDTGPVVERMSIDISQETTTHILTNQLALLAADLAVDALPEYAAGKIEPHPQPLEGASIVRPLVRADGWLNWSQPAASLERRVRAMWPWPRAWTTIDGQPLQIHAAHVAMEDTKERPGTVLLTPTQCAVACGSGALVLDLVQPAGGRAMLGAALLAGRRLRGGDQLGLIGAPPPSPPLIEWLDSTEHHDATDCG
jgi:methionyl-tRNA formyltransferase